MIQKLLNLRIYIHIAKQLQDQPIVEILSAKLSIEDKMESSPSKMTKPKECSKDSGLSGCRESIEDTFEVEQAPESRNLNIFAPESSPNRHNANTNEVLNQTIVEFNESDAGLVIVEDEDAGVQDVSVDGSDNVLIHDETMTLGAEAATVHVLPESFNEVSESVNNNIFGFLEGVDYYDFPRTTPVSYSAAVSTSSATRPINSPVDSLNGGRLLSDQLSQIVHTANFTFFDTPLPNYSPSRPEDVLSPGCRINHNLTTANIVPAPDDSMSIINSRIPSVAAASTSNTNYTVATPAISSTCSSNTPPKRNGELFLGRRPGEYNYIVVR